MPPDKAAWQTAEDAAEHERLRRICNIPLIERLRALEAQSRFLALIRERHLARDAMQKHS
ncbi:MAG: hypothetical protein ACRETW_10035 [Stenotrophobium sp.]